MHKVTKWCFWPCNTFSIWSVVGFDARVTDGETFRVWLIGAPSFMTFPKIIFFYDNKNWQENLSLIISRENYNSWRFLGLSIRNAGRTIEDSAQGLGKGEIEEHLSVGQNLFVSFAKTFATEVLKHIPPWSLQKSLGEGFVALLHRDISQSTKMECFFISDLGEGGDKCLVKHGEWPVQNIWYFRYKLKIAVF